MIEVKHPDYMTWRDKIHGCGYHVVTLKTRRRYVIDCFERVYEKITGQRKDWGRETPNELIKQSQENSRPDCQQIKDFCTLVNRLVFDDTVIKDEDLRKVGEKSRQIILKSPDKIRGKH